MNEKSLLDFVKALGQLNAKNLHHLTGQDTNWYKVNEKYKDELRQVMDLINGFNFVKNRSPIQKEILTTPMPAEIRKIWGMTE